jgi:hypothetical protein
MEVKYLSRYWASAPTEIVGHLIEIDPRVTKTIEQALEEIDKRLKDLGDVPETTNQPMS